MSTSSGPVLPPELLVTIFRLATLTPATETLFYTVYHPFSNPPGEEERYTLKKADETASALVLVCREWRRLALEFVYESVRLNHGMVDLLNSLRTSVQKGEQYAYGRWVRRLELSITEQEDPLLPVTPLVVLRLCPNVEVLVKYDDDLLPHSLDGADLTKIKRLDWWYAWYRDGNHQFDAEGDDHSRGLDFLYQVLDRAPQLQYLSLSQRYTGTHFRPPALITLPSLTTLRLESIPSGMSDAITYQWHLPNLRHLILDSSAIQYPLNPHSLYILDLNPSVEVIELLNDSSFLDPDIISSILISGVALQELNYHIEFSRLPKYQHTPLHPTLNCIRINNKEDAMTQSDWSIYTADQIWEQLRAHFAMFKRSIFPSLDRIVLYGDWEKTMNDPLFFPLAESLHDEWILLESENH